MIMTKAQNHMFASDVHGDFTCAEKMMKAFEREGAERLVLLGDLLYHGPRNDLPEGYAPKKTIQLLNENKDKLLCVRGNCEAEVDSMVLSFPVMADYAIIFLDGCMCYITHGHHIGENNASAIPAGDILINGHTHVYASKELDCGVLYLNPGSVSLPKEGKARSYMIYENGVFEIKELDSGEVLLKTDIREWKDRK